MEEEVDAQKWACGKATESRAHTEAKYGLYKTELDVLQGRMWEVYEVGMNAFHTSGSSGEMIGMLGEGGGHRRRNRKGIR